MNKRRLPGALLAAVLMVWSAACAPAWVPVIGKNPDVQTHAVLGIKSIRVHRIAVMPLLNGPDVSSDAGDTVGAEIEARMILNAGWDVVPMSDVTAALEKLPPTTAGNLEDNAIAVGKAVGADGVVYGEVTTWRERVGSDYAAASPAAVAFSLHLVAISNRQVLWSAHFNKEQKSLSENIFDLANFVRNSGRWVMAHEIAQEGVNQAVANLHSKLNLEEQVEHFPVPRYQGKFGEP